LSTTPELSDYLKPQPVYFSGLVRKSTLYEDAALWSNSDTFNLTIVIGVANWLVGGRAFIQIRPDLLARVKIEM